MFGLPDKLVIVDFETTEAAMGDLELVEVGAIKLQKDLTVLGEFTAVVQPCALEKYTEYSANLTGLSVETVRAGKKWADVWQDFAAFTEFNGCTLAAWGSSFDESLLKSEYKRLNIGYPHRPMFYDIRSMAYIVFAYMGMKSKGFGLKSVCERLEIVRGDSHRALTDAKDTVLVLEKLTELLSGNI